ncbi:MAG TPA: insulinase family protein, partial [Thermoanaerobaculaceae bacterium]|nr:insulinase family protein [Thermoanaerobaculaceae bacterium]
PEAAHRDTHALAVLADALSGGVTSRLYQRLVEPGLCLDVQAVAWQLRDPGLFQVFATLNPPAEHERIEAAIREEVAAVVEAGLTAEELERAKVQVEAHTAFHRDSPAQVASALTESISAADWRFYLDYPDRVRAVGEGDLPRVAAATFAPDAVSVGYFIPRNGGGGAPAGRPPLPAALRPQPCHLHDGVAAGVVGSRLASGATVLLLPRRSNETVHLHGSLFAGHGLVEPAQWTAASVVPEMLERGTDRHNRLELARRTEDRAIEIDVSAETLSPLEVACTARCLARHLDLTLELLAEMLLRPIFPVEELEKLRALRLGELAQAQEDTFARAFEAFSRLAYPAGHPYCRRPVEERRAGLETLTRDEVVDLHRRLYGPTSLVLALVGDFEPDEVLKRLAGLFDGRSGGIAEPMLADRLAPNAGAAGEAHVEMADKPNLDVMLGHPGGLRRADDDFFAAMLGNAVLGHSTLSSRLGMRLRDREGLTYGVVSRFFGASLLDGPWAATFSVAAENLERGVEAARDEIGRYVAEGPSEAELEDERAAMAGSYRVALATPMGKARELVRLARHRLPPEEMHRIPERILATGREEVAAAVRRHIAPAHLCLAAAGSLVANTRSGR